MGDGIEGLAARFKVFGEGHDDKTNAIKKYTTNADSTMSVFYDKYVKPLVTPALDPGEELTKEGLNFHHSRTDIVEALVGLSICDSKYALIKKQHVKDKYLYQALMYCILYEK
jgi:hypothetical protein